MHPLHDEDGHRVRGGHPAACCSRRSAKVWARRAVVFINVLLHIGFGSTFVLGPFAWALCVFSTLLFTREDWERRLPHDAEAPSARSRSSTIRARRSRSWPAASSPAWTASSSCGSRRTPEVEHRFAVRDAEGKRPPRRRRPSGAIARAARRPGVRVAVPRAGAPVARRSGASPPMEGTSSRRFGLRSPQPAGPRPRAGACVGGGFNFAVAGLRELLALAFFAGAVNQAAVELWVIKRRWKVPQPEVTRVFSHKLRFLQGWFMFSPNPVMDDGTIVVDAVTVDGRHIDPFWRKPPNFDLTNAKSFGYNQIWSDYFNRMHLAGNKAYRDAMIEYMRRSPSAPATPTTPSSRARSTG
jgi:hypothetical protein